MVSLKNIYICPIYGPKSIIVGAYAQIWAYSILLIWITNFYPIFDENIQVFKRLVATSRAPQIMVLSMLRSFGKIGPQIDQIWAWLSRGHRWSPGVRNPLKSSVTGPSLLVNCYLEIKFHKIIRVNPPPPLNQDKQCDAAINSTRDRGWCTATMGGSSEDQQLALMMS